MDHLGLLLGICELNQMLKESVSLDAFLHECVKTVAKHVDASTCLIYLFETDKKVLGLRSIYGLNQKTEHKASLKLGENLAGHALLELRPIISEPRHTQMDSQKKAPYDIAETSIGIPITRGIDRIGVLVVERNDLKSFDDTDQKLLSGVANQLAAMIDYVRLFIESGDKKELSVTICPDCPSLIKGRTASAGWAYGAVILDTQIRTLSSLKLQSLSCTATLADFDTAIATTIHQLTAYQEQIEERLADVASLIFAAHILLLKDNLFIGQMRERIRSSTDPITAIVSVAEEFMAVFNKQDNPYFQQKADDIRDVVLRVLGNLAPSLVRPLSIKNNIIIASDLVPSDVLILSVEKAAGLILVGGGVTSHVAILARSLKLPMVIVDTPALLQLPQSTKALIDAETGNLYINPTHDIRSPFDQRGKLHSQLRLYKTETVERSETIDKRHVTVMANVNLISDAADAALVHAAGIGLYRTEFPFIVRNSFPTEEEQFVVYKKLIDRIPGKPITFRTLDVGGDKILSYYASYKERNPFLGMRSMRFCLQNRDVFKQQLRAILRAGAGVDISIMFPMISSIDEYKEAIDCLEECKYELKKEKIAFHETAPVGVMIELPSVLNILKELSLQVAFFSIGTNDLVQYLLGVDRTNEKVAQFYCSHHPSVLRAIKQVADAALAAKIGISVCGDMAHDPRYLEFFIGVGINTISIDPIYFSQAYKTIRAIDAKEAEVKAQKILACSTIKDVEELIAT